MDARNLYQIKVYDLSGRVTGRFFAAAFDKDQAKAIAEQWAFDLDIKFSKISVERNPDYRRVFAF